MAHTPCLVCLVSTVSGRFKNALGRGSTSSRHIAKLEQSTLFRCINNRLMNGTYYLPCLSG
jgi:hypothetical protein